MKKQRHSSNDTAVPAADSSNARPTRFLMLAGLTAFGLTVPDHLHAQFGLAENFLTPDFRGQSDSAFNGWGDFLGGEAFTAAGGPGGNAPNWPGSDGGAWLRQTEAAAGALITGGGSIYSFSGATHFEVTHETGFGIGTVVFQASTEGMTLDYDSVRLRYTADGDVAYLDPYEFSPGQTRLERLSEQTQGTHVENLWQWDLSGLDEVSEYSIVFASSGPHVSFRAASIDAFDSFAAVPEPAYFAAWTGGLTLLLLLARYSRRRRADPTWQEGGREG